MRLEIILNPQKPLDLPIHYANHLRGFFYSYLEPKVADYLHEQGYTLSHKSYKMFNYSRLKGLYDIYQIEEKQKRIRFKGQVSFLLSSIDAEDIQGKATEPKIDALLSFAQNLLNTATVVELNNIVCKVAGVTIVPSPTVDTSQAIKIKMITPLTVHKTFKYSDGSKGTDFFHPFQDHWQGKVFANLENKAAALNWEQTKLPPESYIKPTHVLKTDKKVINDLGFWIEAWLGEYEIYLPNNFFWLAYKAGLGARNSAGLGMFDVT